MQRVLTSVFLAALCVYSQENRALTLTGRVLDPASAAVPNATVKLYNRDTSLQRVTVSDALGAFQFDRLPAGDDHHPSAPRAEPVRS